MNTLSETQIGKIHAARVREVAVRILQLAEARR